MPKAQKEFSSGGIVITLHRSTIRILLIKDPYGRWTWPKGKIDKGETHIGAAKREIREETGLKDIQTVSRIGHINYYYKRRKSLIYKTVYLYLFESSGKKALSIQKTEIADGKWFSEEEALSKIGYKGTKKFLKKAIRVFKRHRKVNKKCRK